MRSSGLNRKHRKDKEKMKKIRKDSHRMYTLTTLIEYTQIIDGVLVVDRRSATQYDTGNELRFNSILYSLLCAPRYQGLSAQTAYFAIKDSALVAGVCAINDPHKRSTEHVVWDAQKQKGKLGVLNAPTLYEAVAERLRS